MDSVDEKAAQPTYLGIALVLSDSSHPRTTAGFVADTGAPESPVLTADPQRRTLVVSGLSVDDLSRLRELCERSLERELRRVG